MLKPKKICGITVRPKWEWSGRYASEFREQLKYPVRDRDSYMQTAIKYARWLAERDGIDVSEADWHDAHWNFVRKNGRSTRGPFHAITFRKVLSWRHVWGQGDQPDATEELATIQIPNFDWQPSVIEDMSDAD